MEEWKDIKGYEGLYQVSTNGNVRSLDRTNVCYGREYIRKGKVLRTKTDKDGYPYLFLSKKGVKHKFMVHRLVALTFLPNPTNKEQVNHKNEVKTDNRVSNLEWCDCKYNINYGTGLRRRAKSQTNRHGAKAIGQYDLQGSLIKIFPSMMEAHRQGGFNQRHICDCCKGRAKTHKGYIFKYITTF